MRRTVATLLVVASPLFLATPVSASEEHLPANRAHPAVVPVAPPAPVGAVTPAVPAPAPTVHAPAVPVPAAAAPAITPPAAPTITPPAPAITAPAAPAPVRQAARTVRAKAPASADVTDAAYTAKLQAELCHARQIFCGLDRNGRYPAG
ncbi:MAG: hypothetical protein AB1679_33275 [Actinomycetota bacterium]